jgi:hypothetical protein
MTKDTKNHKGKPREIGKAKPTTETRRRREQPRAEGSEKENLTTGIGTSGDQDIGKSRNLSIWDREI